jgi:hypothetical protein
MVRTAELTPSSVVFSSSRTIVQRAVVSTVRLQFLGCLSDGRLNRF